MSWKAVSLVLGGIVLGCGAGTVARAVAQVPAAPAGGPTEKYQYTCRKDDPHIYGEEAQRMLNEMGAQGWRLLPNRYASQTPQYYADIYCFERRY